MTTSALLHYYDAAILILMLFSYTSVVLHFMVADSVSPGGLVSAAEHDKRYAWLKTQCGTLITLSLGLILWTASSYITPYATVVVILSCLFAVALILMSKQVVSLLDVGLSAFVDKREKDWGRQSPLFVKSSLLTLMSLYLSTLACMTLSQGSFEFQVFTTNSLVVLMVLVGAFLWLPRAFPRFEN